MSPSMSRLLLLLVVGVTMVVGQPCVPNCTNSTPGNLVPDPKNCRKYYICLVDGEASDVPLPCPDGQKFDNRLNECIDENNPNLTCLFCEPKCKFVCPPNNEIDILADPYDCDTYYVCGFSQDTKPYICPPDRSYFDGQDCQVDPTQCCNDCAAFCHDAFREVPDPTNCSNFYLCKDPMYYPEVDDLLHCPPGEIFNYTNAHCSEEAVCCQPCQWMA